MRRILLVVSLAVMAAMLVQVRRREICARHDIRRHQSQQVSLRRQLWDQQVQLSELTSPGRLRRTAEAMALGLTERTYVSARPGQGGTIAERPR